MDTLTESIRAYALSEGFDAVGVATAAELDQDALALDRWLAAGYHGTMGYMARDPGRRSRPDSVLPGVKSVIVLAMNYYPADREPPSATPPGGRISRYARGRDYHEIIEGRLGRIESFVRKQCGGRTACRSYVDHGPALEKALAREAGLGFIGKNTLLITDAFGSWVFLAVILTTAELASGAPRTSECGSCRLCLDACPTGAFAAPYVLDATRCISYLTIENRADIPEELGARMEDRLFGCDVCQEVCPYNAKPVPTRVSEFVSGAGPGPLLDLNEILEIDSDADFSLRFAGTPLMRAKRRGLRRNAEVVLKNSNIPPAGGEGR